jgi:hypothetical protein
MRHLAVIGFLSSLALLLCVPSAGAATQIRQAQIPIGSSPGPPGTLTLRFLFKNTAQRKRKFTPRRLIRIDFSNVPLDCMNDAGTGTSRLQLTRSLDVAVKLTKAPQPAGKKPKPGRYAFRFAYAFTDFSGSVRGTIDKSNHTKKPRSPRSQGTLSITDLDGGPGHRHCNSDGLRQWGGVPLTGA